MKSDLVTSWSAKLYDSIDHQPTVRYKPRTRHKARNVMFWKVQFPKEGRKLAISEGVFSSQLYQERCRRCWGCRLKPLLPEELLRSSMQSTNTTLAYYR
jgi:hypothetical protein